MYKPNAPAVPTPASEWDQYLLIGSELDLAGRWIEANGGRFSLADEKAGERFLHFVFQHFRQKFPYPNVHALSEADLSQGAKAWTDRQAQISAGKAAFEATVVAPLAPVQDRARDIQTEHQLKTKSPEQLVADQGLKVITDINGRKKFVRNEQDAVAVRASLGPEHTRASLVKMGKHQPEKFRALVEAVGQEAINRRLQES